MWPISIRNDLYLAPTEHKEPFVDFDNAEKLQSQCKKKRNCLLFVKLLFGFRLILLIFDFCHLILQKVFLQRMNAVIISEKR